VVRTTRTQVNPPPETPLTVTSFDLSEREPVEMNASNSSLAETVDNPETAMLLLDVDRSSDTAASIVMDDGVPDTVKVATVTFAPLTVTAALVGLKVWPLRVGVTVYDPFARPVNV
jgi:hypothetical protein